MTKEEYYKLDDEQLRKAWESDEDCGFAMTYLHTHTDLGSPKDSVLTCSQYVNTAVKMGAESVSVTDHGTMYAVQTLYGLCKKAGLKLITGCEFYVCDDDVRDRSLKHTRLHLVIYAKDRQGYKAISRLVTESNKRIISVGDLSYPCISKDLLKKYVGPGSDGYGHVIGTSACIGGVVLGQSYSQQDDLKNVQKMEQDLRDSEMAINSYKETLEMIDRLEAEKAALVPTSKKTYGKRRSAAEHVTDEGEKAALLAGIEQEEAETQAAITRISTLSVRIRSYKKEVTGLSVKIEKYSKVNRHDPDFFDKSCKWLDDIRIKCQAMEASLVKEEGLINEFEQELVWYDDLFGHGNWYAELQCHGIPAELQYMPELIKMAGRHNIPVLAANDAHMQDKSYSQARKVVNALRFKTAGKMWQPPRPDEDELYLKTDRELYQALRNIADADTAFEAMKNRMLVSGQCTLEFGKEPHYPVYVA